MDPTPATFVTPYKAHLIAARFTKCRGVRSTKVHKVRNRGEMLGYRVTVQLLTGRVLPVTNGAVERMQAGA